MCAQIAMWRSQRWIKWVFSAHVPRLPVTLSIKINAFLCIAVLCRLIDVARDPWTTNAAPGRKVVANLGLRALEELCSERGREDRDHDGGSKISQVPGIARRAAMAHHGHSSRNRPLRGRARGGWGALGLIGGLAAVPTELRDHGVQGPNQRRRDITGNQHGSPRHSSLGGNALRRRPPRLGDARRDRSAPGPVTNASPPDGSSHRRSSRRCYEPPGRGGVWHEGVRGRAQGGPAVEGGAPRGELRPPTEPRRTAL
jgi:hypothetical protein